MPALSVMCIVNDLAARQHCLWHVSDSEIVMKGFLSNSLCSVFSGFITINCKSTQLPSELIHHVSLNSLSSDNTLEVDFIVVLTWSWRVGQD